MKRKEVKVEKGENEENRVRVEFYGRRDGIA